MQNRAQIYETTLHVDSYANAI